LSTPRPGRSTTGKDAVAIVQVAGFVPGVGLDRCGKSSPHWDSTPDRPARSDSLYRLRYPGPLLSTVAIADARRTQAFFVLNVPCSGTQKKTPYSILYRTAVTASTTTFTSQNRTFYPHRVLICFVGSQNKQRLFPYTRGGPKLIGI
jgi:hypothetical protein